MSSPSGALPRAAVLLTVAAMLLGALVTVLPFRAGAEPAAAPAPTSASERRYAPGIDPALDADATITGLVLGPRGRLRDDVLVEAFSALDPTGEPVASDLTYEVGDIASHGAYTLHLPAGDYVVRYASPDGATSILEPTVYDGGARVTVAAHQDRRLETVVMQDDRGVPVTGRVLGVDGTPAADAVVSLVRPAEDGYTLRRWTTSAEDGTFELPGVRRGRTFTVAVAPGGGVPRIWLGGAPSSLVADTLTVPAGAARHDVGDIRVLAGTPVSGRVRGAIGPLGAADVALIHLVDHGRAEIVAWDRLDDGDDTYRFAARPGHYTIGVLPDGENGSGRDWIYLGDVTERDRATPVDVVSTAPTIPDLVVRRRTLEVTVDVVDPVGTLDPDFWQVFLVDRAGDEIAWAPSTEVDGRYVGWVPFGAEFTVHVFNWSTREVRYLGDATSIEGATFVTAPTSGTAFHAGTIAIGMGDLTAPTPALRGQARSGEVLVVEPPRWSVPVISATYEWLRDGVAIAGARTPSYLLRAGDVDHRVSVRITGTAPGRRGTVTSEARLVTGGDAPTALVPPTIAGPARLGGTLTANAGLWNASGAAFGYQWLSDGRPFSSAAEVTLGWAEVGTTITVVVTATAPGLPSGTRTSLPVDVARERPRLVVERRGNQLLVRVVSASPDQTGKLTFFGGRPLASVRLTARDHGRARFDLDLLKRPGKRRVSARFGGNPKLAVTRSETISVRVR